MGFNWEIKAILAPQMFQALNYYSGGNFRIEKLDGSLGNLSSPNDPVIRALGDVSFNSYEGAYCRRDKRKELKLCSLWS